MKDYVELNKKGLKLAIINAESNRQSWEANKDRNVENADKRLEYWTNRVKELKEELDKA